MTLVHEARQRRRVEEAPASSAGVESPTISLNPEVAAAARRCAQRGSDDDGPGADR